MQHILDLLRIYVSQYGYATVVVALLLENAGLPVPGETVLLLASFLASSEHELRLPNIILVGTFAAVIGDNIGYLIGQHGGRPLLDRYQAIFRIRPATIARGEDLLKRYGARIILVARFIAGLRILAGPLAGALRMNWRTFLIFNFLGAALWVTVISCAGYFLGEHWEPLFKFVHRAHFAGLWVLIALLIFYWWKRRRRA